MQHADDVVQLAAVGEEPRVVARCDLLHEVLGRCIQVDRLDLRARRHHVLDGDALEIEQVDQDPRVLLAG